MVKPEKFGHLHLVYHFTVPLNDKVNLEFLLTIKEHKYEKGSCYLLLTL